MLTTKQTLAALLTVVSLTSMASATDPVTAAINRSKAINPLANRQRVQSYGVVAPSYAYYPGYYSWYRRGYVLNDRIRAYNDRLRAYNDRLRAAGEVNVMRSHARINDSVAADQELDNHKKAVENYWKLRELRHDKVHGDKKTSQQRVAQRTRILNAQRPKRMTATNWPAALTTGDLAATSKKIDACLRDGELQNAVQYIRQLNVQLRAEVSLHPPAGYLAAKSFLRSLEYALTMELRNGLNPEGLANVAR